MLFRSRVLRRLRFWPRSRVMTISKNYATNIRCWMKCIHCGGIRGMAQKNTWTGYGSTGLHSGTGGHMEYVSHSRSAICVALRARTRSTHTNSAIVAHKSCVVGCCAIRQTATQIVRCWLLCYTTDRYTNRARTHPRHNRNILFCFGTVLALWWMIVLLFYFSGYYSLF